jgi:hypothetical protein
MSFNRINRPVKNKGSDEERISRAVSGFFQPELTDDSLLPAARGVRMTRDAGLA